MGNPLFAKSVPYAIFEKSNDNSKATNSLDTLHFCVYNVRNHKIVWTGTQSGISSYGWAKNHDALALLNTNDPNKKWPPRPLGLEKRPTDPNDPYSGRIEMVLWHAGHKRVKIYRTWIPPRFDFDNFVDIQWSTDKRFISFRTFASASGDSNDGTLGCFSVKTGKIRLVALGVGQNWWSKDHIIFRYIVSKGRSGIGEGIEVAPSKSIYRWSWH